MPPGGDASRITTTDDEVFMQKVYIGGMRSGKNVDNIRYHRHLEEEGWDIADVIRLSLGKLPVNLLQVVKRTNTLLRSLTNGVVDRPWVFWVVGSIPTIHNNKLFRFSHVELEKYSSWYPRE